MHEASLHAEQGSDKIAHCTRKSSVVDEVGTAVALHGAHISILFMRATSCRPVTLESLLSHFHKSDIDTDVV